MREVKGRELVRYGVVTLVAIIGIVALIWTLSQPSDWYERNGINRSIEFARQAEREIADHCVATPQIDRAKCVGEAKQFARANQRQEQDVAAQKVTAWWTRIMGGAAITGMMLSAIGVILVWTTFRATREANEIARQTLMAENRAWMEIQNDISLGDWSLNGDGRFRLDVNFLTMNVGKSVALNVSAEAALVKEPFFGNDDAPISALIESMKEPRDNFRTAAIFPDRNWRHRYGLEIAPEDVQLKGGRPEDEDQLYNVAVCIAIQYRTTFDGPDDPPHHTIEIYNLRRLDDQGRPGLTMVGKGAVPANQLALVQAYFNLGTVT